MADTLVATLAIDQDDDGQFWLSLENRTDLGRKGPFVSEEEAATQAAAFLEETFGTLVAKALTGE